MLRIILMELFNKYLWFLPGYASPERSFQRGIFAFAVFSQFLTDFKNNLNTICVRNRHFSNLPTP